MSPLWRNRLHISISPGQIRLFMVKRGLKPRALARRDEAIDASLLAPPWQALNAKLADLLADPEWKAAEADIVLSNKLVRHALIPFNAQLKKYPEQEAFARHVLTKTYGAVAAQWELRIQHQGTAAPAIVSAVDRTLLESLRQTLAASNIKLRSVTSCLAREFNHHRKAIQGGHSWLVVHESGNSQFTLLTEGKITALNNTTHQGLHELSVLLDRENLTATLAEPCRNVYLNLPEGEVLPTVSDCPYEIFRLEATQPHSVSSFAGALPFRPPNKKGTDRIALNFQKPAQQPNRNAGWMLFAAGVALLVEMGISYDRLRNYQEAMDQEIRAAKLKLEEVVPDQRSAQYTEKDFEAARKILNRLATPWEAFFAGLESISNKHVAILSVVPDMQTGILRVAGEARDYAALLTLVAQLRTTKPFSEVYLSSQKTKEGDPQHPVEFIIYMHWGKQA